MKQKSSRKQKKVRIFGDLKESLQEALAHEQGKQNFLRVTEVPPPPKPLRPNQIRAIRQAFNVSQVVRTHVDHPRNNTVKVGSRECGGPGGHIEAAQDLRTSILRFSLPENEH